MQRPRIADVAGGGIAMYLALTASYTLFCLRLLFFINSVFLTIVNYL